MRLIESFRVAWNALLSNKLRALLTMLGIIIGVGSVVAMLAMGNGFSQYLNSQFAKLGVGVFYIFPGVTSRKINESLPPQLTAADADALAQSSAAPAISLVAYTFSSNGTISDGKQRLSYSVNGVSPSYFTIIPQELAAGRFFDEQDDRDRARVALIGDKIAQKLFAGTGTAINQRVTINGSAFEIIGVIRSDEGGIQIGSNPGESVYLPYQTGRSRLFRNQLEFGNVDVSQMMVKATDATQIDAAIRQATLILRTQHRLTYQGNDFTVLNPSQFAAQANAVITGFSAFLGIVAGISLFIGGIGIMNIMLVSVAERTREIGLRKAVGARRWDILNQFLIEAIVMSLFGCALGLLLGYGLSFVCTLVLQGLFQAEGAQATVTLGAISLAVSVATLVGVCFGFFPALYAARLNPIQALRTE